MAEADADDDDLTPQKVVKKARRDMKGSEVAADDAERAFAKSRKELKGMRLTIKKDSTDFSKLARKLTTEAKRYPAAVGRRAKLFDMLMKKRIKDSLSLKKEHGYELSLGWLDVTFQNVELDLWAETRRRMEGGIAKEFVATDDAAGDDQSSMVDSAQAFIAENHVEKWNTKNSLEGEEALTLDRLACVRMWKKSNTKGGCFMMKKLNYIDGAIVTYNRQSEELAVRLCVQEGSPADDSGAPGGGDDDE